MSSINVISVVPDTNQPVPFSAPFAFGIEYECLHELRDDLEWKMIYVGSAESEECDQIMDSVLVGPVMAGSYRFTFEGNAPDAAKIPPDDLIGVTVVLLTCSYKGAEFIRIGYYVNVEYADPELQENPPEVPVLDKLSRTILTDHPRVTRFTIEFDNDVAVPLAGGQEDMGEGAMDADMGDGGMQHDFGSVPGGYDAASAGYDIAPAGYGDPAAGYGAEADMQLQQQQMQQEQQQQQLPMNAGMVF